MTDPRKIAALCLALGALLVAGAPSSPAQAKKGKGARKDDVELVERLLAARKDYQITLEELRKHYIATGDIERARWAEEELLNYHRMPRHCYRLELDVPPPNLDGKYNIPEANKLLIAALRYKDKGWGTDYVDNQRRAELLLQKILTEHPQSNKISETAYHLGDVYESKAYRHYARAALYFERCVQWDTRTRLDARLRAARLYDRALNQREKAITLYKDITVHETDEKRIEEARKRLADLGQRR